MINIYFQKDKFTFFRLEVVGSLDMFVKVKSSFVDHWTKGTLPSRDRLLVFNFILFITIRVITHFWILQKVLEMVLEHSLEIKIQTESKVSKVRSKISRPNSCTALGHHPPKP